MGVYLLAEPAARVVSFVVMPKNPYRLLLLDLDGTLIGRDEQIAPMVAESVARAARVLDVSIATGREQAETMRFAAELGLNAPQVCDNGAIVFDPTDGTGVWSDPLGEERSRRVIGRLRELRMNHMGTYPGGRALDLDRTADQMTRISALDLAEGRADELVASFASSNDLQVVKVFLPYNETWAVDFTAAGTDKGSAAIKLAELAGVAPHQMIAAGDSYNDLPMFEVSGLRVAMAGAPDELLALADYVAPSVDEDGLAVAIDEFVLPRLQASSC